MDLQAKAAEEGVELPQLSSEPRDSTVASTPLRPSSDPQLLTSSEQHPSLSPAAGGMENDSPASRARGLSNENNSDAHTGNEDDVEHTLSSTPESTSLLAAGLLSPIHIKQAKTLFYLHLLILAVCFAEFQLFLSHQTPSRGQAPRFSQTQAVAQGVIAGASCPCEVNSPAVPIEVRLLSGNPMINTVACPYFPHLDLPTSTCPSSTLDHYFRSLSTGSPASIVLQTCSFLLTMAATGIFWYMVAASRVSERQRRHGRQRSCFRACFCIVTSGRKFKAVAENLVWVLVVLIHSLTLVPALDALSEALACIQAPEGCAAEPSLATWRHGLSIATHWRLVVLGCSFFRPLFSLIMLLAKRSSLHKGAGSFVTKLIQLNVSLTFLVKRWLHLYTMRIAIVTFLFFLLMSTSMLQAAQNSLCYVTAVDECPAKREDLCTGAVPLVSDLSAADAVYSACYSFGPKANAQNALVHRAMTNATLVSSFLHRACDNTCGPSTRGTYMCDVAPTCLYISLIEAGWVVILNAVEVGSKIPYFSNNFFVRIPIILPSFVVWVILISVVSSILRNSLQSSSDSVSRFSTLLARQSQRYAIRNSAALVIQNAMRVAKARKQGFIWSQGLFGVEARKLSAVLPYLVKLARSRRDFRSERRKDDRLVHDATPLSNIMLSSQATDVRLLDIVDTLEDLLERSVPPDQLGAIRQVLTSCRSDAAIVGPVRDDGSVEDDTTGDEIRDMLRKPLLTLDKTNTYGKMNSYTSFNGNKAEAFFPKPPESVAELTRARTRLRNQHSARSVGSGADALLPALQREERELRAHDPLNDARERLFEFVPVRPGIVLNSVSRDNSTARGLRNRRYDAKEESEEDRAEARPATELEWAAELCAMAQECTTQASEAAFEGKLMRSMFKEGPDSHSH